MLKLAITLLHNKSDAENEAQISTILGLVDRHTTESTEMVRDRIFKDVEVTTTDPETGEEVITTEQQESLGEEYQATFYTYYYTFKDFGIPHEVRFYHVVPHGVNRPANLDELDGQKVIYGDDFPMVEKTFFDWGLKRGTDHGAEVSIFVEDLSKLNFKSLIPKLQYISDKNDPRSFSQETGAKIASVEYMKKGGLR